MKLLLPFDKLEKVLNIFILRNIVFLRISVVYT